VTIAQRFAEFAESIRWDSLPLAVQRQARFCLLDMVGATLAGSDTPTAALGAALAARYGGRESAQLIGRKQRTNALLAALVNGMACHSLELDDGHRYGVGLHNGCTTIPAALAVAEEENANLQSLLAAVVLGYEVAGRIGTAMSPIHRQMGFHATGTIGAFGATAAVAYLRGLDTERFSRALGVAGSAGAGLFEFLSDGSTSKHFHAGHAAMAGVVATDLAAGGMTGPTSILEGREGFFHAYGRGVEAASITRGLGQQFEMRNVYFKLHAACGHSFSAIDAINELKQGIGSAAEVERITVRTYRAAAVLDEPRPSSKTAAKFSIPYCVAAAWILGRVTEDIFAERFLKDPAILELARRVNTVEDAELEAGFPRMRTARVEVQLKDGRLLESRVDIPHGMPERPATEDELVLKFRRLAAPVIGDDTVARLMEMVLGGSEQSVRELLALTVPGRCGVAEGPWRSECPGGSVPPRTPPRRSVARPAGEPGSQRPAPGRIDRPGSRSNGSPPDAGDSRR